MYFKQYFNRFFRKPIPYIISWNTFSQVGFLIKENLGPFGMVPNVGIAKKAAEKYMVLLCDGKARICSGVVVEVDNKVAILTARHVVLSLILDGEFHVILPKLGWVSFEPRSIRIHPRSDLALIFISTSMTGIPCLPMHEWYSDEEKTDENFNAFFIVGHPAEWKGQVNTLYPFSPPCKKYEKCLV